MKYRQWLKKLPLLMALAMGIILSGCASSNALESYNRGMYKVNKTLDEYTLKPLAKAYKAVTPDVVEHGVSNFFSNISEVGTFFNSVLQGEFHNAAVSLSRIAWNTTVGLGGVFDVATTFNLKSNPEDFGQTLRAWGVPEGPYVVLPFFGPRTLTDTVGLAGDMVMSPYAQYSGNHTDAKNGVVAMNYVNNRAALLSLSETVSNASSDEYTFVKNAYLQKRRAEASNESAAEQAKNAYDESFFDDALDE